MSCHPLRRPRSTSLPLPTGCQRGWLLRRRTCSRLLGERFQRMLGRQDRYACKHEVSNHQSRLSQASKKARGYTPPPHTRTMFMLASMACATRLVHPSILCENPANHVGPRHGRMTVHLSRKDVPNECFVQSSQTCGSAIGVGIPIGNEFMSNCTKVDPHAGGPPQLGCGHVLFPPILNPQHVPHGEASMSCPRRQRARAFHRPEDSANGGDVLRFTSPVSTAPDLRCRGWSRGPNPNQIDTFGLRVMGLVCLNGQPHCSELIKP